MKKRELTAMGYCESYRKFEKLDNGEWGYKEYSIAPYLYSIDKMWHKHKTQFVIDDVKNSPNYLYGRYMKMFFYLKLVGVKQVVYKPNLIFNHLFKDDSLYVSYSSEEAINLYIDQCDFKSYRGYDAILDGWDMVNWLYQCDYQYKEAIEDLINYKVIYYKEKFPNEPSCDLGDLPWNKNKTVAEILQIENDCKKNMDSFYEKIR
jgi:hypothetical protein